MGHFGAGLTPWPKIIDPSAPTIYRSRAEERGTQCGRQWRHLLDYGLPQHIVVNVEVGVDKTIAHSDNGCPANTGYRITGRLRNFSSSFTNHRDRMGKCKAQHRVSVKLFASAPGAENQRQLGGLEHVLKPYHVFFSEQHIALRLRASRHHETID